jgi:acetyl esterase/lipase
MRSETVILHPDYEENTLTSFLHEDDEIRPAVVVFPGGGYHMLASREAEPIALFYYENGFNTFILRYSLDDKVKGHMPAIQGGLGIKYIREHAAELCVDPEHIAVCGFSAGGHAAASTGVFWNHPVVRDAIGVTSGSAPEGINRPNGMILSYAVLTCGEFTHKGTAKRACANENPTPEEIREYSIECNIDETTPPAFLWHTFNDGAVPVENAILTMAAMAEKKIPFECHIFPDGPHGLALCNQVTWDNKDKLLNPHAAVWADLSVRWLKKFV